MNELISLTQSAINGELQQTVNARELHAFLGSKRKFSDWIKAKLERLRLRENKDFCTSSQLCDTANGGYVENQDYTLLTKIGEQYDFVENQDFLIILSKTPNGGRPSQEYCITLDMAKELAMGR